MNKTVCFIIDTPILESYKSYYVLDAFKENGYRIELIDVSPFLNKEAYKKVKKGLMDYEENHIHLCKNYKELFCVLDTLSEDTYVFDSTGWNLEHYPIYRYLSKRNIKYGYMILNSCYEVVAQGDGKNRVKEFIKNFSFKRLKNAVFVRLPKSMFLNQACSFVINNSPDEIENYKKRFYCDEKTKFLVVHSNLYEEALSHKDDLRIVKNNYCVWLDTYLPYHPDLENRDGIVPEDYYLALRKFFTWIQENFNIEVVVAAHPRSDYELHSYAYEGFQVIKYNTCLLVRDAKFVISDISSSFLYSIVYKKPMVLIYQNLIERELPSQRRFINALGNELGKQPINIEELDYEDKHLLDGILTIDKELYQKSAESYIKQGFDGTISGDSYKKIIVDFLEES